MCRLIASRLTLVDKAGLLLWWVFLALVTVGVIFGAGYRGVLLGGWVFLLLYRAIAFALYGRLRWVFLDGDQLVISNYIRTQRVHLSHVVDVRTVRWLWLPTLYVRVYLNERAKCGKSITFHAPMCVDAIGGAHPIAPELKHLAELSGAECRAAAAGLPAPIGSAGE